MPVEPADRPAPVDHALPPPAAEPAVEAVLPRFKISFRLSLLAVSLITVIVTATAVHLPWVWISRTNVIEMAGQLNAEIIGGIGREIDQLFRSAEATQDAVQEVFQTGTVMLEDRKRRDQFMFSVLRANPHFSWVSLGLPNGDFFGAQRRDERSFRIAESLWDDKTKMATRKEDYYVADEHRVYFTQSKSKTNDYYAVNRQWYQRAVANPGTHIWTDVYIFASSGKPGINTAVTFDRDGRLTGVVSIAIELERISRYLRQLHIAEHGVAFLINRAGEMIAFKDPNEVARIGESEDSLGALKRISESHYPALRIAREAVEDNRLTWRDINKTEQLLYRWNADGANYFVTLAPAGQLDWVIGTVIPEADFLTGVERNQKRLVFIVLAVIAFVMALSMVVARWLFIRPLGRMIEQTHLIERFDLDAVRRVPSRVKELDSLATALQQMSLGLSAFRKYIATDLVRGLLDHGVEAKLGGERRTLTVLFMDLANFTTMTERLGHRILPFLARYLGEMSGIIMSRRGTIDKFIGDAVMAFWGAPTWNQDHAADACRSALACKAAMEAIRAELKRDGRPDLFVRIGVNTGRVVVGNIGSEDRLDYTVIGDPVNLASRLEGMNKDYGTQIIIGHNTYEEAKYDIVARRLDSVTVKGREEPVFIYELLDMADPIKEIVRPDWVLAYEAGLDAFNDRDWLKALEHFRRTIELRGGDAPSELFIRRCEANMPRVVQEGDLAA
jgi:adenylate cyclase